MTPNPHGLPSCLLKTGNQTMHAAVRFHQICSDPCTGCMSIGLVVSRCNVVSKVSNNGIGLFQFGFEPEKYLHLCGPKKGKHGFNPMHRIFKGSVVRHYCLTKNSDLFCIVGGGNVRRLQFIVCYRSSRFVNICERVQVTRHWRNKRKYQARALPALQIRSPISRPNCCRYSANCTKGVAPESGNRFQYLPVKVGGCQRKRNKCADCHPGDEGPTATRRKFDLHS